MILLTALLLAAEPLAKPRSGPRARRPAASAVAAKPTSEWLTGLWVADANKGLQLEGCADWKAVFYQWDGHYLHGFTTGRWTLSGNRLERREIRFVEGGGDEEEALAEVQVARIVRVSQDRLREIGPDGKATLYHRCPKPETPVAR